MTDPAHLGGGHGDTLTRLRKSQEIPTVGRMDTPIDRVRSLLGARGMTQAELGEAIGLDPSKMSKSLGGQRRFSSVEFAQIAERTGVTVDWLLTGAVDEIALAARAESGTNAADAARLAHEVVELAQVAADLGRAPRLVHLPPVDLESGTWQEQGARLADAALAAPGAFGIAANGDLAGAIERVYGIDVGVLDIEGEVDGLCAMQGEIAVILAATTPLAARQRFTLAHELGHALAGDDQGLRIDVDVYNSGRNGTEMRANAFAAAFLMPADVIRQRVEDRAPTRELVAELALDLAVSPSALAARMESLGLVDGMAAGRLSDMTHKQAQQLTGRSSEWVEHTAASTRPRPPADLANALYAAYVEGKTTLRPYARLVGADVEELRDSLETTGS